MSKALDLATLVTSDFATNTDVTNAIDGIVIPEGGKVLQVQVKHLGASVAQTNSSPEATVLDSDTITLSSSDNYLYVICTVNYDLQGFAATVDPSAQFFLYDDAGGNLANQHVEANLSDVNDGIEGVVTLQAFYSPSDTSEVVSLKYLSDNGQIRARGNNNYNNATTLTIMEIAA